MLVQLNPARIVGGTRPAGFSYFPDVLTELEERAIIGQIAALPFEPAIFRGFTAKRRILYFGLSSYEGGDAARAVMPDFLMKLRDKVATVASLDAAPFTEALVTEYSPVAVIGWHRDAPKFGPVVLGVSVDARASGAVIRKVRARPNERQSLWSLRSAYAMAGAARAIWQHSIPAVPALR